MSSGSRILSFMAVGKRKISQWDSDNTLTGKRRCRGFSCSCDRRRRADAKSLQYHPPPQGSRHSPRLPDGALNGAFGCEQRV